MVRRTNFWIIYPTISRPCPRSRTSRSCCSQESQSYRQSYGQAYGQAYGQTTSRSLPRTVAAPRS
eukprot:3053076-Pyramimonas_sp.AAC.1